MIVFLLIILYVNSFSRNGINWWTGSKKPKKKFEIIMNLQFKNDILTLFERTCKSCHFEEKIQDLQKNDILLLEYVTKKRGINVYVNNEFKSFDENSYRKCFLCIQNNFK